MPIITQQSLDLLVSLLNQANPSLPVPVTKTNLKYGAPAVIVPTGGNIQDTSVKLTALNTGQYIGNQVVTYRRINMANLYRSVPIVIYQYSAAAVSSSPYTISQLLSAINAKYGLTLQAADIVDGSLPAGNTNAVPAIGLAAGTRNSSITVNMAAGSYGYEGSFTLYWVQAPQNLANLITTTSLESARVYPGGLSTVGGSGPYVPDLDVFSLDFTDTLSTIATNMASSVATIVGYLTNNQGLGVTAGNPTTAATQFINAVAALTGVGYNLNTTKTTAQSLYACVPVNAVLPAAALPEADSKYFNNALWFDIPAANSWGAGRMIFHYNV